MNRPSVKRQRQGERQIKYIESMVTLGNGEGVDFEASGERHNVFQW